MTTSQTLLLSEIAAGHAGPPIPSAKRAYFQQRLQNRVFNFILKKFISGQEHGLTKAVLARRIGKTPDLINRWLGAPSNLTTDTISDLLLGIAGEEVELLSKPLAHINHNYSKFEDMKSKQTDDTNNKNKQSAEELSSRYNPEGNSIESRAEELAGGIK